MTTHAAIRTPRTPRARRTPGAVALGLLAAGSLFAGGCSNGLEGAFSGAALGALSGLAIGSLTGNAGAGAVAGTVGGAVLGGVIGDQNDRADRRARYRGPSRYQHDRVYYRHHRGCGCHHCDVTIIYRDY